MYLKAVDEGSGALGLVELPVHILLPALEVLDNLDELVVLSRQLVCLASEGVVLCQDLTEHLGHLLVASSFRKVVLVVMCRDLAVDVSDGSGA